VVQNISTAKTNPKTDKPYDDIQIVSISLKWMWTTYTYTKLRIKSNKLFLQRASIFTNSEMDILKAKLQDAHWMVLVVFPSHRFPHLVSVFLDRELKCVKVRWSPMPTILYYFHRNQLL
jgi:hypothetical protein